MRGMRCKKSQPKGKKAKRAPAAASTAPQARKFSSQAAALVVTMPVEYGPRVEPREADKGTPGVTAIRTWNSPEATHIVVMLDDTVQFNAAKIASPDRIYFDLHKAKLGAKLSAKPIDVDSGLLKSVRVAQNKPTTVRSHRVGCGRREGLFGVSAGEARIGW